MPNKQNPNSWHSSIASLKDVISSLNVQFVIRQPIIEHRVSLKRCPTAITSYNTSTTCNPIEYLLSLLSYLHTRWGGWLGGVVRSTQQHNTMHAIIFYNFFGLNTLYNVASIKPKVVNVPPIIAHKLVT